MKSKFKRYSVLILFMILLSVLISGCGEEPSAEEVVSNMQVKMDGLEDYSFTMFSHLSFQGQGVGTQKVIWKKPDLMKTTIRIPDKDTEVIMFSDGKFQWIYDSESETVFKMDISDDSNGLKLFEPNIFAEFLNGTLRGKTASLLGVEDLDGNNAYLLELTPSENNKSSLQGRSMIWVDRDTWMPIR
jgi:outer membrane lipoprotein-sorting protein